MAEGPTLLWINKTAQSTSLSHSDDAVRLQIFCHAQRNIRGARKATTKRAFKSISSRRLERKDGRSVQDDQAASMAMISGVRTLQSTSVFRKQMSAQFLSVYYAEDLPSARTVRNKLQQWFDPERGAAARAAADGMLVLHAARMRNDRDLFRDGLEHHQHAIRLLRTVLESPNPQQDDSLFVAVEVLGVCGKVFLSDLDGQDSSNDASDASDAHARGMYALIVARGPKVLDHDATRDLTLSFMEVPLMSALMARKACIFGQPGWQARLYSPRKAYGLAAIACLLPGLMEETDRLLGNTEATIADQTQLLSKLLALEARFQDWLVSYYRGHPKHVAYQVAATYNVLSSFHELGLVSRYPFTTIVEEGGFVSMVIHYNYWTVMLLVRQTIHEVGISATKAVESFLGEFTAQKRQQWADACTECADMFCQSVPSAFLLTGSPRRQAIEIIFMFMEAYIRQWYVQTGDRTKSEWCACIAKRAREETARTDLSNMEGGKIGWLSKQYFGWFNMTF